MHTRLQVGCEMRVNPWNTVYMRAMIKQECPASPRLDVLTLRSRVKQSMKSTSSPRQSSLVSSQPTMQKRAKSHCRLTKASLPANHIQQIPPRLTF